MVAACIDGIRVIELARYQAGPRVGMVLSDLGAEVIKVEAIGGEVTRSSSPTVDGQSIYFGAYNRGKKSVCVDLRTAEGKEVLAGLVRNSDIVIENFRPGTMEAMGFEYDGLRELKRDIILLRVSAFGQYGPYRERPGFDPIGQAMSGLMALTGQHEGRPISTAFSLVDRTTALHGTIGALGALLHRTATGEGQVVDVCLMDAAWTMVEIPMSYYLSTGEEGGEPGRPPYRAKDGWVVIASATEEMTRRLLEEIGGSTAGDGRLDMMWTLQAHHPLNERLASWCAARTASEICETLGGMGVVAAAVHAIPEAAKDPHLWEREMLVKVPDALAGEMFVPGQSIKFSTASPDVGLIPSAGQHTREVLRDILGYDDAAIAELGRLAVVAGDES